MSGPTRARRWRLRLLLLACAWVVCELLSWMGLALVSSSWRPLAACAERRLDVLQSDADAAANRSRASVIHPYLGFVVDPTVARARGGRGRETSDLGLRDPEPIRRRSPDRLIVAITGGSVAYWLPTRAEDVLVEEIRRGAGGRSVELVKLGLGGYKQPQQLLLVQYLLTLGAEFDVIVNLDGYNEVALYPKENARAAVFPAYPRSWHVLARDFASAGQRRPLARLALIEETRHGWAGLLQRAPLRLSPTLTLLWQLGDRVLASGEAEARLAIRAASDGLPYHATGPRSELDDEAMYAALTDLWLRSSIQLARLCSANDIRYFHFLQPNQYVTGSKPMSREERAVAIGEGDRFKIGAELGYPWLMAAGRDRLAPEIGEFHDLTGLFAEIEEPLYIDPCCHMNDLGNEIMAREIGQVVAAALR